MKRINEIEFLKNRIYNIDKALTEFPDTAGNEYLQGKRQAYIETIELFKGTFDRWEQEQENK